LKFELYRPFGHAHISQMEKDGDVEGLINALDAPKVKKSAHLRAAIIIALSRVGDAKAVSVILDLLKSDPADSVRRMAAKALGQFDDPRPLPSLRAALADETTAVQLWAIQSLGLLRDRESVDHLIEMLDSPDWAFRSYAARALGEIGDHRATEPLLRHVQDKKGTVQIAVLSALRKIGDSRAVGPLREAREVEGWLRRRRFDAALSDLEARFGR
jgi:HEAT repeat protein